MDLHICRYLYSHKIVHFTLKKLFELLNILSEVHTFMYHHVSYLLLCKLLHNKWTINVV